MPTIEDCASCKFRVLVRYDAISRDRGVIEERSRHECRIDPPRGRDGWPNVTPIDWCSYYQPLPAEPDPVAEPAHWAIERLRRV